MRLVPFFTLLCVALVLRPVAPTIAADRPAAPAGSASAPSTEVERDPTDELLKVLAANPTPEVAAATRSRLAALWNRSGSDAADLLAMRASRLIDVGEGRAAFGVLDAAVALAPTWADGRRRRAALHLSRGETDAARGDLEAALRAEPRHFPSMSLLAAVMEIRGDRRSALDWLRRAAALDPAAQVLGERLKALVLEVEGRDI